jgi:hypothetical protein
VTHGGQGNHRDWKRKRPDESCRSIHKGHRWDQKKVAIERDSLVTSKAMEPPDEPSSWTINTLVTNRPRQPCLQASTAHIHYIFLVLWLVVCIWIELCCSRQAFFAGTK